MADITYIPIRQLHPHPDNPRKELGDLSELAASIKISIHALREEGDAVDVRLGKVTDVFLSTPSARRATV